MALGIWRVRAIQGSTVLYPCDGNQTAKLVRALADVDDLVPAHHARRHRGALQDLDEEFPVGGSKTVREATTSRSSRPGSRSTRLWRRRRRWPRTGSRRVIDLYSVKPAEPATLRSITSPIVTVEITGPGQGSATPCSARSPRPTPPARRARSPCDLPHSGKPAELLAAAGIDAAAIEQARARARARRRHLTSSMAVPDRVFAPEGALRRPALRRRLVQGRAPRPARARGGRTAPARRRCCAR